MTSWSAGQEKYQWVFVYLWKQYASQQLVWGSRNIETGGGLGGKILAVLISAPYRRESALPTEGTECSAFCCREGHTSATCSSHETLCLEYTIFQQLSFWSVSICSVDTKWEYSEVTCFVWDGAYVFNDKWTLWCSAYFYRPMGVTAVSTPLRDGSAPVYRPRSFLSLWSRGPECGPRHSWGSWRAEMPFPWGTGG